MAIEVTGPYIEFSSPFGTATLQRDKWFVSVDDRCVGTITRFHGNRRRYIVSKPAWPIVAYTTHKQAVAHLVAPEGSKTSCECCSPTCRACHGHHLTTFDGLAVVRAHIEGQNVHADLCEACSVQWTNEAHVRFSRLP
jgi:hypothetical protein